ncbi:MAG: acetylxylan esterase [bacterium]|nr:acetylxylan esterase [bacterium]
MNSTQHTDAIRDHLAHLYSDSLRYVSCRAANTKDFLKWQDEARPILHHMLGLESIGAALGDHVIRVEIGPAEDMGDHTRHLAYITTEPHFRLPFWYLLPRGEGPFPLALLPHGHDKNGKDTYVGIAPDDASRGKIAAEDRDVALQAVRNGYAAVSPGVRGQGGIGIPDVNGRHGDRDCRSQFMHAILAGRTAMGERVWDMMRLIDWAQDMPEIDTTRILVMGNSGGGIVTLYTAAADTRVTMAVPSCSYCTFVGQTGLIHHCDCNAVPGILRFGEIWDVAALIAPRHLCIVNGRKDSLFPTEEVGLAATRIQALYQVAGAPDRIAHRYGPEGHRFYSDLMWPFITRANA